MKKLFEMAHEAQECSVFEVANIIFAILIQWHFKGVAKLPLVWETNDVYGADANVTGSLSAPGVWYDLLVIYEFEGERGSRLCIPVPLLERFTSLTALKCAKMEERSGNGGHTKRTDWSEARIWNDFFFILPQFGLDLMQVGKIVRTHLHDSSTVIKKLVEMKGKQRKEAFKLP